MKINITIILLIVLGFASYAFGSIKNLGVHGKTYSIAETDALQEIESRAASIDWQKAIQSNENLEKLKNFKPRNIPKLPRAIHDRTFLVDMTYTLELDIPNGKGGILYPAGYTFNPLDYMHYPRTLVVFDAADPEQIKWLEASAFAKDINTRLLITDGTYFETRNRLSRHVYFAMPTILKRFQLQAVPSVIRQKGNQMEVTEIDIAKTKE
jgi:conjugal transfer pilus assembly protein TraW